MRGPEPPALPLQPPPPPGFLPPASAPPGKVEALVAKSGFTVYEPGRNLFDEPLMVYLARPRSQWPNFDIYNHTGRILGASRSKRRNSLTQIRAATNYYDRRMNQILRVQPHPGAFKLTFEVTGVANAEVVSTMSRFGDLIIQANNEPYGMLDSPPLLGMSATYIKILDLHKNQVGAIRTFRTDALFRRTDNYVVSIDPQVRGELRRVLITVPTMIAVIRGMRQ
jgi:hypothetical protein